MEIVTNEPDARPIAGEVGPTRRHRVRVAVEADELGGRGRVEKTPGMSAPPQRRVDDDSAARQGGSEQIDDGTGQDRSVPPTLVCALPDHDRLISYLPRALVAIAIIPRNPPTDEPVSASTTMP